MNYGPPIKPKEPRPPTPQDQPAEQRVLYSFRCVIGLLMMWGSGLCGASFLLPALYRGIRHPEMLFRPDTAFIFCIVMVCSGVPFLIGRALYKTYRKG